METKEHVNAFLARREFYVNEAHGPGVKLLLEQDLIRPHVNTANTSAEQLVMNKSGLRLAIPCDKERQLYSLLVFELLLSHGVHPNALKKSGIVCFVWCVSLLALVVEP